MSGQNDTGGPQLTSCRSMHTWVPARNQKSATFRTAHHCWTALRALPSAIGNSQIRTLKASWPTGDSVTSSSHSMTRSTGAPGCEVFLVQTQQGQVLQTLSSFFCFRDASIRFQEFPCFNKTYWISLHSWISIMLHIWKTRPINRVIKTSRVPTQIRGKIFSHLMAFAVTCFASHFLLLATTSLSQG